MKKSFLLIICLCFSHPSVIAQGKTHDDLILNNSNIVDTIWGEVLTDHYRDLENYQNIDVVNWLIKNNSIATSTLSLIPNRLALYRYMKSLNDRKSYSVRKIKITLTQNYFYLKKYPEEKYYKLYYRRDFTEHEEMIFDPKHFRKETGHPYTINYIEPSWNGNYVAISMSYDGRESSDMVVLNVNTRKTLPYIISNCWPESFGGISWLPDNSGFTYLHFPITDPSDPLFYRNSSAVLHRLGDEPDELTVLLNEQVHKDLFLDYKGYPLLKIFSPQDKYIFAFLAGVSPFTTAYYAKISDLVSDSIRWMPLYDQNEKVLKALVKDNELIYLTAKISSNYQIKSFNLNSKNFDNSSLLVPQFNEEVIEDFAITSEGIFFHTYKNGVESKLYFKPEFGSIKQIETPIQPGYISLQTQGFDSPYIWISMDGWTNIYERYRYDLESNKFTKENILDPVTYPEFDDIIMEEVEVVSHDGTMVPLSIIYSKNTKKNGNNSVFIEGYGAYGNSQNPIFSTRILSWVARGGIHCTAHVRGGGEKGESWRLGGFKKTKPNSWKDLIASAEYLIENGYTKRKKIAIYGGSAGGILVGGAMNERPDLFGAVIAQSGMMNPLRNEEAGIGGGGTNYKEYGTIKDSLEFQYLMAMDPYHNLKRNTAYPATLLTTGMNETRVSPAFPAKFAARLREYNISDNPVLLQVDFEGGHSQESQEKITATWADFFAFAFWQTGHPDFQPKTPILEAPTEN